MMQCGRLDKTQHEHVLWQYIGRRILALIELGLDRVWCDMSAAAREYKVDSILGFNERDREVLLEFSGLKRKLRYSNWAIPVVTIEIRKHAPFGEKSKHTVIRFHTTLVDYKNTPYDGNAEKAKKLFVDACWMARPFILWQAHPQDIIGTIESIKNIDSELLSASLVELPESLASLSIVQLDAAVQEPPPTSDEAAAIAQSLTGLLSKHRDLVPDSHKADILRLLLLEKTADMQVTITAKNGVPRH